MFVKQVNNALRWLKALLALQSGQPGLRKVYSWSPSQRAVLIQTDASPFGLGGVLSAGGKLVAYFSEHLSEADFNLFGSTRGDPAFQSEYELLAVLVALRVVTHLIASHGQTWLSFVVTTRQCCKQSSPTRRIAPS